MNIHDIAKLANVSGATVSRAINGGKISKATKDKIFRIMEEHSFTPNVFARGLKTNSIRVVGVVVSDISDMYFSRAVAVIEKELRKNDYEIILYCAGNKLQRPDTFFDIFAAEKTDGFIFVGSRFTTLAKRKAVENLAKKMPVIMVNADISSNHIYSVTAGDKAAVRETAGRLFDKGKRRFIYLYDAETASGHKKLSGFREAVTEYALPPGHGVDIKCRRDILSAKQAFTKAFREYGPFDAAIASEDEIAVGVLKAAHSLGLVIPDELSVVGYNNSILSETCTPELASIDSRVGAICELAAKILVDVLNGLSAPKKTTIDCELIERKTI